MKNVPMHSYDFPSLLDESARIHGHLCPGQVLGVRMAIAGLKAVAVDDPKGKDRKSIMVFVEMDRCATDAIQSVTGCSLGKRSMKFLDYGKMAASFLNLKTRKAVRIVAREEARDLAKTCFPEETDKYKAQLEAYKVLSDADLFTAIPVTLTVPEEDMPGRPLSRVQCDVCSEFVQDRREVNIGGRILCRSCASVHQSSESVFFSPAVMHNGHNGMTIRSKIWIDVGGEPVFGRGRRFLLEAIDKLGSIRQAAQEISISYRKAWGYIKSMEERLGFALVDRHAGGKDGGGASLTENAKQFLKKYRMLEQGIHELVDDRFSRIFSGAENNVSELSGNRSTGMTVPVSEAVGMALAHDITEIRKNEFKGRAFRKGHIVRSDDVEHLRRLGKEKLFVLSIQDDEMHEDEAALLISDALKGEGVSVPGEPKEGKLNLVASRRGLLKINAEALRRFNRLGEVMCATLHTNTVVREGQIIAATRAIPLVVKKPVIEKALQAVHGRPRTVEVLPMHRPKTGIVITGNEVYHGRIADAFGPIMSRKVAELGGSIVGIHYAPDDEKVIEEKLRGLLSQGADLLITTGGMSVDPDDVTRFAIRQLGAKDFTYGSAVLPGAMFLIAYLDDSSGTGSIPILGIPACGMYHKTTIFDIVVPRVLAGERIVRDDLAALGHGGLCLHCAECRYPACPFGKSS
ncbi:MAG TPA: FmdE family protein [Dissulfurispiraceae bacterium]|nr:FmdE family protein [Dissulfurispiraceae bacterium]